MLVTIIFDGTTLNLLHALAFPLLSGLRFGPCLLFLIFDNNFFVCSCVHHTTNKVSSQPVARVSSLAFRYTQPLSFFSQVSRSRQNRSKPTPYLALPLRNLATPPKPSLAVAFVSSTPVRTKEIRRKKNNTGQPRREKTDRSLASCNLHLHACKAAFLCTPPCRPMLQS